MSSAPLSAPHREDGTLAPRLPLYLRHTISRILLVGVLVAGALLVVGVPLLVSSSGGSPPTGPVPLPIRTLGSSLQGGGAESILWLGLIILVATPLARVAISVLGFARLHDAEYVAMTSFVLAVLVLTAVFGAGL